jgi:benzoyl-CoA reductase/2-hydroxyglutaryl-CoA dehydratase subunit BcrC/BadD/HgdB
VKARRAYLDRVLKNVCSGIKEITGKQLTPESLAEAALLYGHSRALQRKLYHIRTQKPGLIKNYDFYSVIKSGFFLPASVYNDMLKTLLEKIENQPAPNGKRPKLLVSGMVFDPIEVYKIFDELGADIVDDDFANGWRTVSKQNLQVDNLLEGVTAFLFNPAPCCCIYNPDNDRHPYLLNKVKQSGADGILFWYIKFCEPDAFDRPQLMKRFKQESIPAGFIDIELSMTNFEAIKTRINAFCEILEG